MLKSLQGRSDGLARALAKSPGGEAGPRACYARLSRRAGRAPGESYTTNADTGSIGRPQRSWSEASRRRTARPTKNIMTPRVTADWENSYPRSYPHLVILRLNFSAKPERSPSAGLFTPLTLRHPSFAAVRPIHPCIGVRRHAAHPALARHGEADSRSRRAGPPHLPDS